MLIQLPWVLNGCIPRHQCLFVLLCSLFLLETVSCMVETVFAQAWFKTACIAKVDIEVSILLLSKCWDCNHIHPLCLVAFVWGVSYCLFYFWDYNYIIFLLSFLLSTCAMYSSLISLKYMVSFFLHICILLSWYNVTCMYVFRAKHLILDNQEVVFWKTISSILSNSLVAFSSLYRLEVF